MACEPNILEKGLKLQDFMERRWIDITSPKVSQKCCSSIPNIKYGGMKNFRYEGY